jgi:hypothetical protein
MATFSQQFLANLGRPAMGESLFGLGRTIGGLPGQAQDRRKREQFNELMQQGQAAMASNDAAKLAQTAQDLAAAGYQKEAQQFSTASRQAATKQRQMQALSGVDLTSPAGLTSLSEFYKTEGDIGQAVQLATAARERQTEINEANRFTERKVKLANTAFGLGLNDLAERIPGITDPEELRTVATEMREAEIKKMPTQSPLVRKQMARAAGVPDQLFSQLDLANVSDDVFSSFLTGQKGEMQFFLKDNKVVDYRVNKESGLVFDRDSGTWTEASTLGLQPAPPQLQKVQNISAGMADEMAKVGAARFVELAENAQKAADSLSTVNRSLPRLDNMYTGAAAEIKLNIQRYADIFPGLELADVDSIADTEAYIADSGRRVAEYIRNLGAGTGLSDADREYAKAVVAGNITVNRETLRRLLQDIRKGAQNKIDKYKTIRGRIKKSLGEEGASALAFFPEDFYVDEGPAPVRSEAAQSFLDAAS